jgi:hypothetical protein
MNFAGDMSYCGRVHNITVTPSFVEVGIIPDKDSRKQLEQKNPGTDLRQFGQRFEKKEYSAEVVVIAATESLKDPKIAFCIPNDAGQKSAFGPKHFFIRPTE